MKSQWVSLKSEDEDEDEPPGPQKYPQKRAAAGYSCPNANQFKSGGGDREGATPSRPGHSGGDGAQLHPGKAESRNENERMKTVGTSITRRARRSQSKVRRSVPFLTPHPRLTPSPSPIGIGEGGVSPLRSVCAALPSRKGFDAN